MQWQNEQLANLSSSSSLPYWFQILVLKVNLNNPSSLHIAGDSFLQCFLFIKYWIQCPILSKQQTKPGTPKNHAFFVYFL